MPRAEGRELRARGQRTMRQLLDAGLEVFGKRGYHPARVDDIVKVAKTSHGTFYLYFSNKEDLFRALEEDVAAQLGALAESLGPIEATPEGYEELRAWLGRFADLHARYGPVIALMDADVLVDFAAELTDRVGDKVAALALVAMIERFNYYVLAHQVAADRTATVETLAEVAYAALFGKRGTHE